MNEVIIATKNRGKAKDFEALLSPYGIKVLTLFDVAPDLEIEETGTTFRENAALKAETVSKRLGKMVIADDSGLAVDALDGKPGVYSARYSGEGATDERNIEKLLADLSGVPDEERTARFVCVLAIAAPGAETQFFEGTCEGRILRTPAGENGFGYDPVFYVPREERTMAQLTPEEKAVVSHRGEAIRSLEEQAGELFGENQ
ncbi:XTP/dITP diphosphatase [Bhargavaea beijingensis]|uniref:dITP/XTP pyrophosphatase n=1 Tax=Bhargavaea beijingensis TaxID=426756 RepID=A0A1G7D4P2_9BACL|nr:XTP/dITP diphosphatase [Bhargavaea beijingensis]MCW1929245.1 XTP/dITP diphosphatase [Bhargavaea beijingensis]SDE45906.1 XTP/dITP diphosphohydrolase [Bhargavaea beijingensis]